MAKYSSTVHYNITTSLDASGITKLQAELNKIEHELNILSKRELIGDAAVTDALSDIRRIQSALTTAFNPKLGMMNMNTFMSELTKGGRSLTQIYNTLGTRSTSAMANLAGQLGKIDTGMKSVSKATDKLFNTIGNTVRWGVIASGFQYVLNSAHSAVQYMRDLDESLTNIRLVTDESKESMREFAKYANEAAQSLGNTTVAYTDAALIYAQQGYGLSDQKQLANITLMTANVTGQETSEVSEQMTSLINGYQLKVDEVQGAMDKLAEVANVSAADLEELATATSKVASTANALGVTQDELTAQIATIVSVTREAPENVGNALKTIYARLGDLQMGETLEDGTDLGKLSGQLEAIGVQVMDASGGMRGMGDIMEDLMAMWDQLDVGTKQALAVKLAGKYQYNRLMALMENEEKYSEYLTASENSTGTLDEMQSEYMESLEGKINALVASLQGALTSLFDQDSLGPMIEGLTEVVDLFTQLTEAIGGGEAALTAMSAVGVKMFSGNIGRGISNIIANRQSGQQAKANIEAAQANANAQLAGQGINTDDKYMKQFLQDNAMINRNATAMSDEQIQRANQSLEERKNILIQLTEAEKKYDQSLTQLKAAYLALGVSEDAAQMGLVAFLQTLEADGVGIEDATQDIQDMGTSLRGLRSQIAGMSNAVQGVNPQDQERDWASLQQRAEALGATFKENEKLLLALGMSGEDLIHVLKELQSVSDGNQQDFKKFDQVLTECVTKIEKLSNALSENGTELVQNAKQLEQEEQQVRQLSVAFDAGSRSVQGFAQQLTNQNIATHIANLTSGVTSMMFAVQSFQALGSIWTNEDLTIGEKVTQTLMNGTLTISMLAMAYVEMSDALSALKKEQGASTVLQAFYNKLKEKEIALAQTSAAATMEEATTKGIETTAETANSTATETNTAAKTKNVTITEILTLATKKLAVAAKSATKAMLTFTSTHPALMALGAAAAIALIQVGRAHEEIENSMTSFTEGIERHSSILDQFDSSNYRELYKVFDETQEVTEEFKNSALELAESLGVVGAASLVEAGNFKELNEEIERCIVNSEKQLEINRQGQNALISNTNTTFDWRTDAFQRGFDDEFTENANFSSRDENLIAATGIEYSHISGKEIHGYSFAEQVGKIYQGIEKEQAAIDELNVEIRQANNEGKDTSALEEELKQRQQTYQDLKAIVANDDYGISTFVQNTEGLATTQIENTDFSGLSYEEAMEEAQSLESVIDYYAIYGEEAGQAFIQSVLQQLGYGTDVALEQWVNSAKENITLEDSSGKTTAIDNLADLLASSANYSEEEKLKIIGTLDKEMTTEEINNTIAAINEGQSVEDVALVAGGEDAVKKLKASYNAEGEQRAEALDIDIDEFKEYRKLLADSNEELENNAAALNEVAVANKRMEKGVKALSDDWDDFNKIMSDSEASLEDISSIAPEVNDAIQDILNISDEQFELLPPDFAKKNWDLIQDVVNGVEGSIDTLRNKAGEEILLNIKGTIDADGNLQAELLNLHNSIAAMDATQFDVGIAINRADQEAFYANCEALIAAAGMTAEQAQAYFASMGYDVELEKVQDTSTATSTYQWFPLDKAATAAAGGVPQFKAPQTVTMTETKHTDALAIKTITPTGSYGGGIGVNTTASNSSRGGSGGGGGGSSYEPKTQEKIENEPDRYQDVNAHLDRLSNELEKVSQEQDRLTRKETIANLKQQAAILEEQVEWQEKKLALQKEEAQELKDELAALGVTFDSEGYMTNYVAMHQKLIDEVNTLIDQYNATTSEEGQEALAESIDAAKKELSEFEELWSRYDELVNNGILETVNLLEDLENQLEDLNIEAFNIQIEAQEVLKDTAEAWIDLQSIINNFGQDNAIRDITNSMAKLSNAFDNALISGEDYYTSIRSAMSELYSDDMSDGYRQFLDAQMEAINKAEAAGTGTVTSYGSGYLDMLMLNVDTLMEQIQEFETTGTSRIFGQNSGALQEAVEQIYQSGADALAEFEDQYKRLRQAQLALIDEIGDAMDEHMEKFQNITDQLEHHLAMVELLYGDESYEQQNMIRDAMLFNVNAQIQSAKAQLDLLKEEQAKIDDVESEAWKKLQERIVQTQSELNSLTEQAIQITREREAAAVSQITNNWVKSALGTDLEWMETQWELINRNADYYLDDVNSAYEIQKLQGKYLEMLDNAGAVDSQRQITAQMKEQLDYLRGKTKLSEYDVAYANAQLEILQKRIALEEAQANKSQMKLRRDSQGNYSYVYTANEDAVRSASSDLLDAENNAYNLSKEQMIAVQEDSMSALAEAYDLINNIWTNANLTLEEKKERTQIIIDSLREYLQSTEEQLETSQINIINDFIGMCDILVEENEFKLGEVYEQIIAGNDDAFSQIDARWDTSVTNWLQNMDTFLVETDYIFEQLVDNAEYTEEQIADINESAGESYDDLADTIDNCRQETENLISAGDAFIRNLQSQAQYIHSAEAALKSYAATMDAIDWSKLLGLGDWIAEQNASVAATGSASAGSTSAESSTSDSKDKDTSTTSSSSSGSSGGSSGTVDQNLVKGIAQAIWTYGSASGWGNDPTRSSKLTQAYGSETAKAVQDYINKNASNDAPLVNYDSKKYFSSALVGYDTGGYTGTWSDGFDGAKNGKLAWLHQKELILNADDTENILSAVDTVRQITASMKEGLLGRMVASLGDRVSGSAVDSSNKLEQDVHITATFPNVRDAGEIEEALMSLVDEASQWVNRIR